MLLVNCIRPVAVGVGGTSGPAARETVGNVTLTAKSCNDLEFSFDYGKLNLGSGTRRLQRPFSLETAGYECRDYAARVAANH